MPHPGIVYDVGLNFTNTTPRTLSILTFNPTHVAHDMHTIAETLHATAVRLEGEPLDRLATAARLAHAAGLTVYINPWKMHADVTETGRYLSAAAKVAEQLRVHDGLTDLVFVAGCEYSIFSRGVFPGETFEERAGWFGGQLAAAAAAAATAVGRGDDDASATSDTTTNSGPPIPPPILAKSPLLNAALRTLVTEIRTHFHGPVTYAAGIWEAVDWDLFDLVGVDYYRRGETASEYLAGLEQHRVIDSNPNSNNNNNNNKQRHKPLVVMEVGCCAYEGAAVRGDGGFVLLKGRNPDGSGVFEGDIVPTRSEREQADYLESQLGLLARAEAQVDAVFVYVFAFPCMPAGVGARDFDMMCFSLVKYLPEVEKGDQEENRVGMPQWVPKEAFFRVAECFRAMREKSQLGG
ncbi:hypothetical protein ASPACDRAFT_1890317 [Aspergillus aculeatus ATCC 16872]|uniref:Uncharacterized protein n=1 Tax=Aspergillus aculeatus (strain ATCC 16872 / CBS 172.66 / WB 5094) TaxID=690307 RepID=A0A1L9WNS6_ASPA1|nr:uncharacterized protein ASPACDRAFT_1890317 [Aspergillus aculeatus ATCC 16872]OJJ97780.1 hypothetical protein ASPACDRAFT_1890317 [Aspergillus aculeatus ATCC 16872]